ncbi:MAG TPA: hypothetical protein VMT85_23785 [Thermoanaerobaculia bacterium]|nr:hypothetical protein [Thermoanaerobaculia bacterium]
MNEHLAENLDMGSRGVARPMALRQHRQEPDEQHAEEHSGGHDHGDHDRLEMLRLHHRHTLWIPWTILALGVWQMLAPVTLGHLKPEHWVHPSGGRGVWFSEQTHDLLRAQLMTYSDVLSGVLLLVFGWRTLRPNRPVGIAIAPWLMSGAGLAAQVNATLCGLLIAALAAPRGVVRERYGTWDRFVR